MAHTMHMLLIHGRKTPDEELDDWGPEGPTLTGIVAAHGTYRCSTFSLYFESIEAAEKAQALTGWPKWDDNALEVQFHEDMVLAKFEDGTPGYFGDFELQTVTGTGEAVSQ